MERKIGAERRIARAGSKRGRYVAAGITCLLLLTVAGCFESSEEPVTTLPYFNDTTLTPLWVSGDSVEAAISHRAGPFSFVDQRGESTTEALLDGKVTVVDFFFTTCPSLCPKLTRNMLRLQDSLTGVSDAMLLSISVTPERDSVPVLAAYAEANGIDYDRWRLLTGTHSMVYGTARGSFFADVDTGPRAFLHSETFYLLDGNRRIRGVYNGTLGTDIVQLVEDIRALETERKAGRQA